MEDNKIQEVVNEIKSAKDDELNNTIKKWFEKTRSQSMKIGAGYISAAIAGVMEKHLKKGKDASLRDHKRMTEDIWKIISVQLKQNQTQQNDLENDNDGTTEEIS